MTVAHRGLMVWPDSAYKLETIREHGSKLTQAGLFFFEIQSDGSIVGQLPDNAAEVAAEWPHIRWLLTVMNHGYESIWRALLTDQAAQDRFISEIGRILDQYPWADGLDVDLERGPVDLEAEIYALYERIYRTVKARGRHMHIDLPPMEGPYQTIGPESWCSYERIRPYADTLQIMTYGYAWSGSSVSPAAPVDWFRRVMSYAVKAFDPSTVFAGVASYGHRWQIYDYPDNPGVHPDYGYRGTAGDFSVFLEWMQGEMSHTDRWRTKTETQKYIPFASFWDEADAHHLLHLHIYDYPGAGNQDTLVAPMIMDEYDRPFLTAYSKQQETTFTGTVVDRAATAYTSKSGALDEAGGAVWARDPETGETEGAARYTFTVPAGTYDVVCEVLYPWWDRQRLTFALDGVQYTVGDVPQWYPYHRQVHWVRLARVSLASGTHTLEFLGAQSHRYTKFYGFRICSAFGTKYDGGQAEWTVHPRELLDVHKAPAWPDGGRFKLTLETLRRDPEHALIWYDDARDWEAGALPANYYTVNSGSWTVHKSPAGGYRPYSWVTGSGDVRIAYSGFEDVTVRAGIYLESPGRAGVAFADLWLCCNTKTQQLELYQGNTLLGSYPASLQIGGYYTLRLRVRGTEITGYLGVRQRITATATVGAGAFGVKADTECSWDLLTAGDSYVMYPQEALTVTLPDGTTQTLGRIPRTGVTWLPEWEMFRLESGEEEATRSPGDDGLPADISMEWDYIHSRVFALPGPGDYPLTIRARDAGVWLSTAYLGDADGFSLAMFPDATSILRYADIAAYEFRVRGIGMWNIGLEDPQLWDMLVDHTGR